jgi:hypothetical protein
MRMAKRTIDFMRVLPRFYQLSTGSTTVEFGYSLFVRKESDWKRGIRRLYTWENLARLGLVGCCHCQRKVRNHTFTELK